MLKNKRADIPVTILVILTIALCMFALMAFYMAEKKIGSGIGDYNILDKYYIESENDVFLGTGDKGIIEKNVDVKEGFIRIEYTP